MKISYNITGPDRKKLVAAIAEILECDAEYMKTPTCAYRIGDYTVDRDGNLNFDDRTDSDEVEQLVEALLEKGFEAEATEEVTGLCISYPRTKISDGGIERLNKLLEAKGGLIKKALGIAELPVETDDEKVSFPWFDEMPEPDEIAAYSRFICALCAFAENQKRVTAKETEPENEKYAFRCFLLRLGFIGDSVELKKARKILLSKLSGSGAFKSGHKRETEPGLAAIPTPENTAEVNVEEVLERLQDPQVQEEIKAILNGGDENVD